MRLKKPDAERSPMIYHNFDSHQSFSSTSNQLKPAYQKVDRALTEADENTIEA
jgi:hypothetical protein